MPFHACARSTTHSALCNTSGHCKQWLMAMARRVHSREKTCTLCRRKRCCCFFLLCFGGFEGSGSSVVFLLTQPWRNGTVQHDYASHIWTNCQQNNEQRTCVASGGNMHAKILFPLKIRRWTFLTQPPSATDAVFIRVVAGWRSLQWHGRRGWEAVSQLSLTHDKTN